MQNYMDSPQYRALMSQVIQGSQGGPQYPGQAIGNSLATALNGYFLGKMRKEGEQRQAQYGKDVAGAVQNEYDYGEKPSSQTVMARLLGSDNPDVQSEAGSIALQNALKGDEEYTLAKGGKRFRGGNVIADNPEPETPPAPFTLGPDQTRYGPDGSVIAAAPSKPDKANPNQPFNPDGSPNKAYQDYELLLRKSGSQTTNVNVSNGTNAFNSALGGGGADILKANQAAAQSARDTINNGNMIRETLDSGNVLAGPMTSWGIYARQALGADPQKLEATRGVIKGLAEQTLAARGALKGQGQVSNYEGELLEKAKSGNIDALTIPEIKVILDVNERLGRKQLQLNREGLDKAGKVPNADPALLGLYSVDDPTTYQPKKKAGGTGNPLVDKYLE